MSKVYFKQGDALLIHSALLRRAPKLPQFLLHSKEVSRSAGHVIVHYLYTNTYDTLGWVGPATGRKESVAKFMTALEVYSIARQYDLEDLEKLAQEQILLHSKPLDAIRVVDAVNAVYPIHTAGDTFFPAFMERIVERAFDQLETLVDNVRVTTKTDADVEVPLASTILSSALQVYRKRAKAQRGKDMTAEQTPSTTTDAKSLFSNVNPVADRPAPTPSRKNQHTLEGAPAKLGRLTPKPTPEPTKQSTPTGTSISVTPGLVDLLSSNCAITSPSTPRLAFPPTKPNVSIAPGTVTNPFSQESHRFHREQDPYSRIYDEYQCLVSATDFTKWSNEELRLTDYQSGRRWRWGTSVDGASPWSLAEGSVNGGTQAGCGSAPPVKP